MKKLVCTLMLTLGLTLTFTLGTAHANDCKDVLESNRYRCTFNFEGGKGPVTRCMQFDASNPAEGKFSAGFVFAKRAFQCSCQTKGSLHSPQFNEDKAFICGEATSGDAMIGKAADSKIKSGEYWCQSCNREEGSSGKEAIFACQLDPECRDDER